MATHDKGGFRTRLTLTGPDGRTMGNLSPSQVWLLNAALRAYGPILPGSQGTPVLPYRGGVQAALAADTSTSDWVTIPPVRIMRDAADGLVARGILYRRGDTIRYRTRSENYGGRGTFDSDNGSEVISLINGRRRGRPCE